MYAKYACKAKMWGSIVLKGMLHQTKVAYEAKQKVYLYNCSNLNNNFKYFLKSKHSFSNCAPSTTGTACGKNNMIKSYLESIDFFILNKHSFIHTLILVLLVYIVFCVDTILLDIHLLVGCKISWILKKWVLDFFKPLLIAQ